MTSRDDIKSQLITIGQQKGYGGEMVEIASDFLSYLLYQNQIEIANASQESSLATARLMNSKIKLCMESMYAVYRGYNARVLLNFKSNTVINKNRFDLVYESNTFKLYAAKNYSIVAENGSTDRDPMECIIVNGTKYEYDIDVDKDNQYYIDVLDPNGHPLTDLSEDIKVTIDGIEYPTTRNFYDHINTPIATDLSVDELDKIFVLTTTDFGVRLYKRGYYDTEGKTNRGYFKIGSHVHVECFKYTKFEDVNQDEYGKISLPGTELYPFKDTVINAKDGTLCYIKGVKDSEAELPVEASLGDCYDIATILYAYLNTPVENPEYVTPENNPEYLTGEKFIDQNTIGGNNNYPGLKDCLTTLSGTYDAVQLNLIGRLASTKLLPEYATVGDTYFIQNIPWIYCKNLLHTGEEGDTTPENKFQSAAVICNESDPVKVLANWIFDTWKKGAEKITYWGELTGETLLPETDNIIGDTYAINGYNADVANYHVHTYLPYSELNPNYKTPEQNPEYIDSLAFVEIGGIDDFSSAEGIYGRKAVNETERENAQSILYNANSSMHTQSSVLSTSDVCHLFSEFFINEVKSANTRYCPKGVRQGGTDDVQINTEEDTVYIFYVPRIQGNVLSQTAVDSFTKKHGPYFVTNNIKAYPGQLLIIDTSLEIYLNNYDQINSELNAIFSQYTDKLTNRSSYMESDMGKELDELTVLDWDYDYYEQLIDLNSIYAQISKINYVSYVNKLDFVKFTYSNDSGDEEVTVTERIPTSRQVTYNLGDGDVTVRVPIYYKFNLLITYKNSYEIVS